MHFLLAIVTLLGTAAYWYFQMRRAGSAAHHLVDTVQRARGAYRRKKFLGKAELSPIAAVDDPVAAAVAMLISLSREGFRGPTQERVTQESVIQETTIKTEMRDVMRLLDVEEAYIFARWVADHADDSNMLSFRFSKLWITSLDLSERAELYAIAGRVVAAGGAPTSEQTASMKLLRDRLGLTL